MPSQSEKQTLLQTNYVHFTTKTAQRPYPLRGSITRGLLSFCANYAEIYKGALTAQQNSLRSTKKDKINI